jgi:hypothetical protein
MSTSTLPERMTMMNETLKLLNKELAVTLPKKRKLSRKEEQAQRKAAEEERLKANAATLNMTVDQYKVQEWLDNVFESDNAALEECPVDIGYTFSQIDKKRNRHVFAFEGGKQYYVDLAVHEVPKGEEVVEEPAYSPVSPPYEDSDDDIDETAPKRVCTDKDEKKEA